MKSSILQSSFLFPLAVTATVPFSEYILAPTSRDLRPISVHNVNGSVDKPESLLNSSGGQGSAVFSARSAVTFDYSKNIGGVVSITVGSSSSSDAQIGVTFSESSLWISGNASDATADNGLDKILLFNVGDGPGTYTAPHEKQRGGFRYLSLINDGDGDIEVTDVSTHFTAMPHYADNALQNYTGWFHSNDDKLNRVWYAGAYTNQLCVIEPEYGDMLIFFPGVPNDTFVDWYSNKTISNGTSVLVDGAKRDRLIWPGDNVVAVPSIAVSTHDIISAQNGLDVLFLSQNATGQMPYASDPFNKIWSFTYHLHSLISLADVFRYTGDKDYFLKKWNQYKLALNYSLSTIDDSGLAFVTSSADWLRFGMGGHNIEANAILYYVINDAISLATTFNDTSEVDAWATQAQGIKSAANNVLWNDAAGLFIDNETTTLMPQDGNVWAIKANLTTSTDQNQRISAALQERWTKVGPPAVEAEDAISPFVSSVELEAHFLAGEGQRALDLTRLMWADFMLDDPRMTNSTFIEGYASDGTLHYAPYTNDPRVNHAHGWGTGPTSHLTTYVAGIQILSAAGKTWAIRPQPGDLTNVSAGFQLETGQFSIEYTAENGSITSLSFSAPEGTTGSVAIPAGNGAVTLKRKDGSEERSMSASADGKVVSVDGVIGGEWTVEVK